MLKLFKNLIIFSFFISLITSSLSCSDEPVVPFVPVNIKININYPEYSSLKMIGNAIAVTGGAYRKGIIIYRKSEGEFVAYDRTCPYHPQDVCGRVDIDVSMSTAECKCCKSKFILLDGMCFDGPSKYGLTSYDATNFDKYTGILYITNQRW